MRASGVYKGKLINYNSGKLIVGLKSVLKLEEVSKIIEGFGGQVVAFCKPNILDVKVQPDKTLELAKTLSDNICVRFASPEIIR